MISVVVVLVVSAICSLSEAALYAVRMPYISQLVESGSVAGKVLAKFKHNMEQPITAILIVNTVANTAGAAIAGAQARDIFDGRVSIFAFSAIFTLLVLFLSEIMPKIAGVAYARQVATLVSVPVNGVVAAMHPVVWLTEKFSRMLKGGQPTVFAPETEVVQMAVVSAEEGSILHEEAGLVGNVLRLDDVCAKDIMTPRTVALTLSADTTLRQFRDRSYEKVYSRIPLYAPDNPENWIGVVRSQDILTRLANDEFETVLQDICRPIHFVPEQTHGHHLLTEFLTRKVHLLGVVDEYGSITGIVTLEDIMESLVGVEIVDETDLTADLQKEARARAARRFGAGGTTQDADDRDS
jgi:CBS domain containing-hemolysin-like protein